MIADGAPTVFSEESYDDRSKWNLAIDEAIQNTSINRIYLPNDRDCQRDSLENAKGNLYWYAAAELTVPQGILPVYKRNRYKYLIAVVAFTVVAGIGLAAGWFVQEQDLRAREAAEELQMEDLNTEASRIDIAPIIDHCIETLGEFWPMAPEWTLVEEGCVVDPDRLPRGIPDIRTRHAFSYRLYRLVGQWNEFLAGHAVERVTREFSGSIHRNASSMVLYRDVALSRRIVEPGFQPETDVIAVLDKLFVGNIKIEEGISSRRNVVEASSPLELRAVLDRMKNGILEAVSARRRFDPGISVMRVRPIVLQTERTRTKRRLDESS